jgi:hypothetical protein
MLESGLLIMAFSEVIKALKWFEQENLITTAEKKALLELAGKLKIGASRTNK